MTTSSNKPRLGEYYSTSWGYDQTNIDFLVILKLSPSGKTAICRMTHPLCVAEERGSDVLTPGGDQYGSTFKMTVRPDGSLRGSYPFCESFDNRRLDTFRPIPLGKVQYQTALGWGH